MNDNLYELLASPVEEIERALQRGEDILAADINNNAMESGLKEKAREYQVLSWSSLLVRFAALFTKNLLKEDPTNLCTSSLS